MKFKAYVINMKKSTDRKKFMSKQLSSQQIDYEIFEAIDGKTHDFSDCYDEKLSLQVNRKNLSSSEKGCSLSHRLVLEKALKEDLDYILILEDDVELPSYFKEVLMQELERRNQGKTSWDYLAFNYPTVGLKYIRLWLFLYFDMLRKDKSLIQYLKTPVHFIKFLGIAVFSFFEGLRDMLFGKIYKYGKPSMFYRPMYLAGCYLLTKDGLRKILSVNDKLIYAADKIQNVARTQKSLKIFWFVPLLVKQRRDQFESTMNTNARYIFSRYD